MRNDKILAVRVPQALRAELERLANEREVSVSALARQALKKAATGPARNKSGLS